jgi:protein translocase SecG subunit
MFNLLANTHFWQDFVAWAQVVCVIIVAIACLVLIVAVLVSPPQTGSGQNAITGASESYFTKNRRGSNHGRIRNLIIACAITIFVCSILYFIFFGVYSGGVTS